MATKMHVASVSVENGSPVFTIYGPPDDAGKQSVIATKTVNLNDIKEGLYEHCAAVGFAGIAAQKYTLKGTNGQRPNVAAEVDKLYASMLDGTWTPGRATGPKQPSPFVEAMANLTGMTVDVIAERMKDKSVFTKSKISELRHDPSVAAEVAKINKARADAAAKLAAAAGKTAKATVDLAAVFGAAA
jgi:hypothetical protein